MRARWFNLMLLVALMLGGLPLTVAAAPAERSLTAVASIHEDFEGSFPPTDWTLYEASGGSWEQTSTRSHSGSYSAYHDDTSGAQDAWLVTPEIDVGADYILTYWENVNFVYWADTHEVLLSTSSGNPADGTFTTTLRSEIGSEDTWEAVTIDLSSYAGETVYLAFRYVGDWSSEWFIDDVVVDEAFVDLSTSEKSASGGNVQAGDTLTYSVSLKNTGLADGVGTTLVDPIPTGTDFASIVSPADASYNAVDNQIEWTGTVSASTSVDVVFTVDVTGTGLDCQDTITNSATISQTSLTDPVVTEVTTTFWDEVSFAESFEADDGGFTTSGTDSTWEYGTPTTGPAAAHSGDYLWATNLDGEYVAYEDSYLTSPVIDLSGYLPLSGYPLYLSWWEWRSISSYSAYYSVEVSDDGGGSWDVIYGPVQGGSATWEYLSFDVSEYASANFRFRIHLYVDSSFTYEGIYVDDVTLVNCTPPPNVYLLPDIQGGKQICPGDSVSYEFDALNFTGGAATVQFMQESGDSELTFDPTSLALADQEQQPFVVTQTLPTYAFSGATILDTFLAYSGSYSDTSTVETLAGNKWLDEGSAGAPTLWPAYASDGDRAYYLDGLDENGDPMAYLQIFEPGTGWYTATAQAVGEFYGGVAGYDAGTLYYAPGFEAGMVATDTFMAYDIVSDTWASLAPMPETLGLGGGGVTDDGTFVWIGGSPDSGFLTTTSVYLYDIATDAWSEGTELTDVGLTAPGYVVDGDKVYIGGSYLGSDHFYMYDVSADTWTRLADLPPSLLIDAPANTVSPLFLYTEGGVYSIGGGFNPSNASLETWRYDVATDTWDPFGGLNQATLGNGGAVIDSVMYTFGGGASVQAAHAAAPHERNIPMCEYADLNQITGQVTDGNTGAPLEGAVIDAEGLAELPEINANEPLPFAVTDANGAYTLTLASAVYELTASYGDYEPQSEVVTLTTGGATQDFVLGAASVAADPAAFGETLAYNSKVTRTMQITNDGYSPLDLLVMEVPGGFTPTVTVERAPSETSEYSMHVPDEKEDVVLALSDSPAPADNVVTAPAVTADVELMVDDGSAEDALGLSSGGQFLWLNRFTPDPSAFPFQLNQIAMLFSDAIAVGDDVQLVIWEDADGDGDPGTGANFLVSYDVQVQANDYTTWNVYDLDIPVDLTNVGDVLIGAVNRSGVSGYLDYPAGMDIDGTPQSRSWIGLYSSATVPNPPTLPADNTWGLIDDLGFPGNWTLRGYGTTGVGGGDIPWLTTMPTQTTLLPGESAMVELTFDATDVGALGVYTGSLLLEGGYEPITVPVKMTVTDNLLLDPDVVEETLDWGHTATDHIDLTNYGDATIPFTVEIPYAESFYEDFEGDFPPEGWDVVINNGAGWMRNDAWGRDNLTPGTGYAAAADSDAFGTGMDTELWTPPIDLSGASQALLSFANNFQVFSTDEAYIDVSIDGGTSWTNVAYWDYDNGPTIETVDLSAYTGEVIRLRFRYVALGWDWYWQVDDVTILTDIPWLSIEPVTGAVTDTGTLTVTYDASAVDQPGSYYADALFASDEIIFDRPISVTMHAAEPAEGAHILGTVYGNRTADGDNMPLAGVEIEAEGPEPFTLFTGEDGAYDWWLMSTMTGTYTLTYMHEGYQDATAVVDLDNGATVTKDITLTVDSPYLNATPEALSDTLGWGGSSEHAVTLSNPDPAQMSLDVDLLKIAGSYTPAVVQTVQVEVDASAQPAVDLTLDDRYAPAAPARTLDVELSNLALDTLKVLILSDDANQGDLDGLDAWLNAYPDLEAHAWLADNGFPTLSDLLDYQVVIVGGRYAFSNAGSEWTSEALGELLADYVEAGGGVIMIQNAWLLDTTGATYGPTGRFQDLYSPVQYVSSDPVPYDYNTRNLGVRVAGHPLMADVDAITDNFRAYEDLRARPGSETVAYYDDGLLYVAANPGKVVAINQVLTFENNWTGDVPQLVHNAILYLADGEIPWLQLSDDTDFNIPVDDSDAFTVTLDASTIDQPGTYNAWIWLDNNDLIQQGAYIPVEMDVEPAANMALLAGAITSDRLQEPMEGADVMLDMPSGMLHMQSEEQGEFRYWFPATEAGSYMMMAAMPGYVTETMTVTLTAGMTTTVDVELKMDAPWLQHTAESMDVVLLAGDMATRTLLVENFGQQDLEYELGEVPPTMTVASNLPISTQTEVGPLYVEPEVEATLATEGNGGYLIYLRDKPDLSPAFHMDWDSRGRYVVNALQTVAERSQSNLLSYLDAQGTSYQAFWIDNVIAVENSDYETFQNLYAFSEIFAIRSRRHPILYEPTVTAEAAEPNAVESNISHVRADEVWADYGVTGEGIVVANIDTGVRYSHEALVDHYRGNTDGGFDHNYNWWDPYANTTEPNDTHDHGSHTMGTMLGDDGGANQIGMAPGAQWLACQGFNPSATDTGLLECAQFMAAPWDLSGQNENPDLRPNVVNNSWGDCGQTVDPWYKGVIDAWHAAGIYPVFSNGNAGNCGYSSPPGLNTVGNPARYGNVTGVGSTGRDDGQYATHSNWGPTDDPDTVNPRGYPNLKPQVMAPGVNIRSAYRGADDAYGSMGGTSMSAPHVAGLIALMWEAAPCLAGDYANIETIMEETAIPIPYDSGNGDEGPGNVPNHATGWGEIDAYAAVAAAIDHCGVDVPWLVETPISGTIAPMDHQVIDVVFHTTDQASGLNVEPGFYTATLRLRHNDPMAEAVSMPVSMLVLTEGGPELAPATAMLEGDPGETVTYTLTLTNTSAVTDTFDLALNGNAWLATVDPASVEIGPLMAATVEVAVTIPADALYEAEDTVTVTATSDALAISDSSDLTTQAGMMAGVDLAPATDTMTGEPDETLTYTLSLTNTGNTTDTFTLAISGNAWTTQYPASVGPLAAEANAEFDVTVDIPADAMDEETDTVTVTATSQLDAGVTASSMLTTDVVTYKLYLPFVMR